MANITNSKNDTLISGTGDSDIITNTGTGVTIRTDEGNDYVTNKGQNAVIDLGKGSDWLQNSGADSSINAGEDAYEIYNTAANVTINAAGSNRGTLQNTSSNVTIISSGSQITNEGSNVVVRGEALAGTLNNSGDHVTIDYNTKSSSIIENSGSFVTITGGVSSINNNAENVVIDSRWKVSNHASHVTISASDSIQSEGSNVVINNTNNVQSTGSNVTLNGIGYITLDGSDNLIQYKLENGNQAFINGFDGATDKIKILDGTSYMTQVGGGTNRYDDDDYYFHFRNGGVYGYMQIIGGASLDNINISGGNYDPSAFAINTINNSITGATINGTAQNDLIRNVNAEVQIYSGAGHDTIYNTPKFNGSLPWGGGNSSTIANGDNASLVLINAGAGDDYIKNDASNVTISAGDGNDTVYNDNVNNLLIDGGTLDGGDDDDYLNGGSYSSINGGSGDDTISGVGNDITIKGGTGSDCISLRGQYITVDAGEDNDQIICFQRDSWDTNNNNLSLNGGAGDDTISITRGFSSINVFGGDGNDLIINDNGSNVTVNGGEGNDTVNHADVYQYVGGNDVITDRTSGDKIQIVNGSIDTYSIEGNDVILKIGQGSLRINNARGQIILIDNVPQMFDNDSGTQGGGANEGGGGIMSLSISEANTIYSTGDQNDSIENGGWWDSGYSHVTIRSGAGNDTIANRGTYVVIDAGDDNDHIDNWAATRHNSDHTTVNGGAGNDWINNGGDYASLVGGNDDDYIQNYGGHSTIDGGAENDEIKHGDNEDVKIFGGAGTDTINIWNGDTVPSSRITVDGGDAGDSLLSRDITYSSINGGDGNDSITNWGGDHNTIEGGKGDDSIELNGEETNLVIKYANGDGNDTISGFKSSDKLSISGSSSTVTVGNNIVVNVGSGSITLIDAVNNQSDDGPKPDIENRDPNKKINGTSKAEWILNHGSANKVTINVGAGNDTINNNSDNVSINAGAGDDFVDNNEGSYNTIDGGDGNDDLWTWQNGAHNLIRGGKGNDFFSNFTSYSTMLGEGDNDTLCNAIAYGENGSVTIPSNVLLNGGDGNDYIENEGSHATIEGGKGNDSIRNYGLNASINTGDGDDTVNNLGESVSAGATINGGNGNDTIENNSANVLIDAGEGDNFVSSGVSSNGSNVTIRSGSGKDTVCTFPADTPINSDHMLINTGGGSDSIMNWAPETTIDAGDGDNSIENKGASYVTIKSGAGKDRVLAFEFEGKNSDHLFIDVGANDDLVFISDNSHSTIKLGDGNDLIDHDWSRLTNTGNNKNLVDGEGGDDTIWNSAGTNSTFRGGTGNDTILNGTGAYEEGLSVGAPVAAPDGNLVEGGEGDDVLENGGGSNVTLDGGLGNDTIKNKHANYQGKVIYRAENVSISGGDGDDYIDNEVEYSKIDAGNSNDTIYNGWQASLTAIDGGAGNDTIYNSGEGVTINGGAGNDYINLVGYAQLLEYGNGDGNDIIFDFNDDDTLKITSGSISNASVSGTDILLKIGSGSINLKNAAGRTINLMNSAGSVTQTVVGNVIRGTENDDTLNVDRSNAIIQPLVGNDLVSLSGSKNLLDYEGGSDTIYGLTSDDTIRAIGHFFHASVNGNDLLFDNDERQILTLKDAADKSIRMLSNDNRGIFYTPALNKNALNDAYSNGLDEVVNCFDGVLIDANKNILYNYGSNVTLKTNGDVYSAYEEPGFINNVFIQTGDGDNNVNAANNNRVSIDAGAGNDYVCAIECSDITLKAGKGDDLFELLDVSGSVLMMYEPGDGDDVVFGLPGVNARIKIDGDFSTLAVNEMSDDDVLVKVGNGSILLVDALNRNVEVSRLTSDDTLPPGIVYDPNKPSVITVKDPYTGLLDANDYSEKITLIDASAATKPVALKSGDKSTVIRAGDGGSTMIGGKAADKLYGGNGIDYFTYTLGQGADVFYDVEPKDVISISGAWRSNLILKDNKNVVTVTFNNDSKSKLTINKINSVDPITFNLNGRLFTYGELPKGVTYDNNDKKTAINVGATAADGIEINAADIVSTAKTIDASEANGEVYLTGNDNANIIKAGAKGSTLYGGAGKDVFEWSPGEGADVIYGFDGSQGDYVRVNDVQEIKASDVKIGATKVEVTIKNQKLTLDNPNGEINFIDTDGTVIYTTGVNFPPGVGYNKNKTAITVGSAASNVAPIDLSSPKYLSTVKEIDATEYKGAIDLTGNDLANILRAGSGGSTLNGGLGADKLYGGAGKDVFVYESGGGNDVVYGFDGTQGDYILLEGVKEIKASDVKASATKVDVTIGKGKLTFDNPTGEMNFVDTDGTVIYTMGINFPKGVGYDAKKTAVTVGSDASNVAPIDLSSTKYLSTVKEINATAYGGALGMIGNGSANVLYAGGSTMNGGLGADKLYGGAGADVFVYKSGDGSDMVYGFDGAQGDYIVLEGVKELKASDIKASATKVDVTIGKGKLTFDNPIGEMNFVDSDGTVLYTMGINFPNGMGYDAKKTAVTIGSAASNVAPIDLSSTKYLSTVKEINAAEYKGAINIVGNGNANILRAGDGGSTLNGSYDTAKKKVTADKLYGGSGKDVFVWDAVWGGADQIYSYSAAAGDIISVTGVDSDVTIDNADFKLSGNKVVLTVGTGKLTVNDLVTGKTVTVAYGDKTFGFATLPAGVGYAESNKSMTIGGAFKGAFDVATQDYLGTVTTIDASSSANEIELIGNKKTKAIVGGKGKTTVIGSTAVDNFYAGTGIDTFVYADGGGKDVIYNFDGTKDVIRLSDTTIAVTDFVEKGNDIVLTVGKGSITFKDALKNATQSITVEQDGGAVTYKTLPTGVTYKYTASKQTGVVTVKDFSGTLKAADLGLPVTEINAASATNALELRAASNATKIAAGKGGATLIGGDKDDTLIGGAGADVFVSSGGKDLIDKYTAGADKVSSVGTLNTGKASGSNVELTTSDGAITIKGGVGKELTVISGNSEKTYKFEKKTTNLADALVENASELAVEAEDYWFMQSEDALDELSDITAPIAPCVLDEPKAFARPSVFENITYGRHSRVLK